MRGDIGTKLSFGIGVMGPKLLYDFDQTCSGFQTWEVSATCDVYVTQLQCQAILGRSTDPA
jgi:hypothetical protein